MSATKIPLGFELLPSTVYKYRRVDESALDHTLSLIKNGTIFFASASTFNDPFDTALGYDFEASDKAKRWYINQALKKDQPHLYKTKKTRRPEVEKVMADWPILVPREPGMYKISFTKNVSSMEFFARLLFETIFSCGRTTPPTIPVSVSVSAGMF